MANIKRIKLSDGSVYSIFDEGALRLNNEGKLVTGNIVVDQIIVNTDLYITGGIGTNNIPVRIFNHPSINFYRLRAY